MAMFIVKPWYKFNPDIYFDPVTHIATEENFIKFLQCGVYDSKYIGYKVQLSNTAAYNNGLWVIADVDHDSANTGQTNCYDLICQDCFTPPNNYGNSNWRNSNIRSYLNNNFYQGFASEIKNHILNIKYMSDNAWYNDNKIIEPSYVELNGNVPGDWSQYFVQEGTPYPIFTPYTLRIKKLFNTSDNTMYWTRTKYSSGAVLIVNASSTIDNRSVSYTLAIAPLIRVQ